MSALFALHDASTLRRRFGWWVLVSGDVVLKTQSLLVLGRVLDDVVAVRVVHGA